MNALLAYFSYTGHTRGIARQMRDITGGGLGHIPADIKTLSKGAKVLDSLHIYENGGSGAKNKITDWLDKSRL